MKHLPLQSRSYQLYIHNFGEWLSTLGYSSATAKSMPVILREFLHYCENRDVMWIGAIEGQLARDYITYIQARRNSRREGALSVSYVNSHIRVLHLFSDYLRQGEKISLSIPVASIGEERKTDYVILSVEEIKQLYHATDETPYGMRDRAMLAVYYGSGLRKSEGINLDVGDILFERKLLYIRKSKNNHERYVPLTKANLEWIAQWVLSGRGLLLSEGVAEDALFISARGKRISEGMMYLRLKALQRKAGMQKETGLHSLRHSIATHLLQKGMPLENIALFLGHRCLDSTQIYTHILNETV